MREGKVNMMKLWMVLGVCAAVAVGVRAKEVACPVALWEDMSALFELGEPLDLLDKMVVEGGTVAPAKEGVVVSVSTGAVSGGEALSVDEDFAGLTAGGTVELVVPQSMQPVMDKMSDGVGVWVKADPYVYLSFRFCDATGRTFSIPAHRQKTAGWEYAASPLKSVVLWRGRDRRAVHLPARLIGVQLSTVEGDFGFDFSAQLRGLQRVGRPVEDQPQRIKVEVENPPAGLIYRPGQSVGVSFSASDRKSEIRWKLVEYGGRVLAGDSARGAVKVRRTLDQAGHYQFLIELHQNGKRIDYRTLSLGVVEESSLVHERIGLCGHWNRFYYGLDTLDLLPLVGVNRVRDHVALHQVEKRRGEMSMPKMMGDFLAEARKRGIRGMTILNGKAIHYGGGVPHTPEAVAAFGDYCRFVAREYAGVFDQFELWNEWSNGTGMEGAGFEPTPESYVRLADQVIPELRRGVLDQAEVVGFGGENPYRFEHEIVGMLKAGGGNYFDSISLHPYRQPFPPEIAHNADSEPLDETMKKFAVLSRSYDGPEKIQVTEMGYPVFRMGWGVSEVEHARYMVRTLAMLHSVPEVDQVYWYSLRDETEIPLRGNAPTSISFAQHGYGLFRDRESLFAPKPAAVAMAVYVRQTAGAEFGPLQRLDNDVFRVDVSEPGGRDRCSILWTLKDPVEVQVSGKELRVIDLMGRGRSLGEGKLTVSQDAVYLSGKDIQVISASR